jgi:CheY-like chemotaxis protein
MGGYDIARRLREKRRFEDALLIAITGYADEGHRFLAMASGFDQYLVKPAEPSAVEELLALERDRLAALQERPGRPSRKSAIHLAEAGME